MRNVLLLSLLFIVGCGDRTELLLVIHQKGLRLGVDIEEVNVTVRDLDDPMQTLNHFIPITVCGDTPSSGCRELPVRILLLPGESFPHDNVRVLIDGVRNETRVLSSAVQFQFTKDERLRLDVVLHANCIGRLDCAVKNQVCLEDGSCAALTPTTDAHPPDLATPDLATPDLARTTDLAGADFAGVDLAGCCANRQCGVDPACQMTCGPGCSATQLCDATSGHCVSCGAIGQACCGGACPVSGTCDQDLCRDPTVVCGHSDEPCCMGGCVSGFVCNGNSCVHCGFSDELCCPAGGTRCFGNTLKCSLSSGRCEPCGAANGPCCDTLPQCSLSSLTCAGGNCTPCGDPGQPCCYPTLPSCNGDTVCNSLTLPSTCQPCGGSAGALCCNDDPRCRSSSLACNSSIFPNTCADCGGAGEFCCDGDLCDGNLMCLPPPFFGPSTCGQPPDMAGSDMAQPGDMSCSGPTGPTGPTGPSGPTGPGGSCTK